MTGSEDGRLEALVRVVEASIRNWPSVERRTAFGERGYAVDDKVFALVTADGLVLSELSTADQQRLASRYEARKFRARGRPLTAWMTVPVESASDFGKLLPYLWKSYEAAVGNPRVQTSERERPRGHDGPD